MLGLAPGLTIIDLTHDLPPHDVRAGALTLVRAAQYLPDGCVVLAVVDPGVGTDRRLLAVACERATFVGPDNGLLAPAVALLGGAGTVVSLTRQDQHLPAPGPTFAGRDILAPATAHLALDGPLTDLGDPVDPASLLPGLVGLPTPLEGGALQAEVWWVDRFGNCQLNVDPDALAMLGARTGDRVEVRTTDGIRAARWVRTYADAKSSELVLLVDSYGLLSLALDRDSAASALGLQAGSAVTLAVDPGARRVDLPVRAFHGDAP